MRITVHAADEVPIVPLMFPNSQSLCGRASVRQPLNCISALDDVHERYSGNLANTPPKFAITCCDNIAVVRGNTMYQAVVGIGALMRAMEAFEAGIAGHAEK
jgi:hypothetical protein